MGLPIADIGRCNCARGSDDDGRFASGLGLVEVGRPAIFRRSGRRGHGGQVCFAFHERVRMYIWFSRFLFTFFFLFFEFAALKAERREERRGRWKGEKGGCGF